MKKILIIGATSVIAQEVCKMFAANGDFLFLVARHSDRLKLVADDLAVRGVAKVDSMVLDINDSSQHGALIEKATGSLGGLDMVLIAHGTLGDQRASEQSYEVALKELTTNFLSVVSLLTWIANQFEEQKAGTIAVISSVAGDRGRQSNYVYGTAKGAVSVFLQGLRNRLYKSGVTVLTIKPGFVDTPMTAHLKKNPLFASPEKVARIIYRAIQKRKDVVYAPGYWRGIMAVVRMVPENIFKRLRL